MMQRFRRNLRRLTPWQWTLATVCMFVVVNISLGCIGASNKAVKVIPDPSDDARVLIDGNQVGTGVTEVEIPKDTTNQYELKVCGGPGYFCNVSTITGKSPDTLKITVPKDHSYFETVDGVDNVNKWIILPINAKYGSEEAWQKLTSSISLAIADFEVLDQKSLYLKTAWKVAGKKGDQLRTRSRIVVAVDNPDPENLRYKFKIESERIDHQGDTVEAHGRTFREFLEALETSRARLGQ